uniref:Uncharacterized protein n=1 Tax=Entomoneis paludosa TaxID=265537 RepID=A0A7S3DNF0_9STRA
MSIPTMTKDRYPSSQPIGLSDLFSMQTTHSKRNASEKGGKVSCLKKRPSSTKKSLRFATNPVDDQVWSFVRTVKKMPKNQKSTLWWAKSELEDCYDDGMEDMCDFEKDYKCLLKSAFVSCKSEGATLESVFMCFGAMVKYSEIRGLETEVLPQLSHVRRKHRRAVLSTYSEERCNASNDDLSASLRQESLKHSNCSTLFATKMGEFDAYILKSRWTDGANMHSANPPPPPPASLDDCRKPIRQDSADLVQPEDRRQLLRRDDSAPKLVQRVLSPTPTKKEKTASLQYISLAI